MHFHYFSICIPLFHPIPDTNYQRWKVIIYAHPGILIHSAKQESDKLPYVSLPSECQPASK